METEQEGKALHAIKSWAWGDHYCSVDCSTQTENEPRDGKLTQPRSAPQLTRNLELKLVSSAQTSGLWEAEGEGKDSWLLGGSKECMRPLWLHSKCLSNLKQQILTALGS